MSEVENSEDKLAGSGIAEVKTFIDLEGRQIKQFSPIDGSAVINKGLATINTSQGPQPFEFNCPEGDSIEKCFENFDKEANIDDQELENLKKGTKNLKSFLRALQLDPTHQSEKLYNKVFKKS